MAEKGTRTTVEKINDASREIAHLERKVDLAYTEYNRNILEMSRMYGGVVPRILMDSAFELLEESDWYKNRAAGLKGAITRWNRGKVGEPDSN